LTANQIEIGQTPEEYEKLLPLLQEKNIQGLIHVLPTKGERFARTQTTEKLFLLLKNLAPIFKSAEGTQKGIFNLSFMGGRFALEHSKPFVACDMGTHGLIKAVAREWPHCRVQCLDFDPDIDADRFASAFWQALTMDNPPLELGFDDQGVYLIDLVEEEPKPATIDLGDEAVILVTGGAYGVTADCVMELIQRVKTHLVILGRSQLPEPSAYPEDPSLIRQMLIEETKAQGLKKSPAEIEQEIKTIIKNQAILANMAQFQASALSVHYHSIDVRDEAALEGIIAAIGQEFGSIDGIVHGAGVIEDKWLTEKSFEAFERVFATKVDADLTLAKHVDLARWSFFAFVSSVSGRFGIVGQTDYSAANEVLNKLADLLAKEAPSARIVSINWGPWDSGMVSDGLRRLYQSRGIELIPLDEGKAAFVDEILSSSRDPEVVITRSAAAIATGGLGKGVA
jgi:NAD(P)-dependent dehydrogenase (short-subunit alcohol dehydrogenase family)